VAGEDLSAVRQLREPAKRMKQSLGAFLRANGEVGTRDVADEQRVSGQHHQRLVALRPVDDR
jgi:hypothetical protein